MTKTYIKGDAVANATSYELSEKKGNGTYTPLETKNEINFELDALGLAAGNHTLVVKAKADGYEDSDYSNEVIFSVEDNSPKETTWYIDNAEQTGKTFNYQMSFPGAAARIDSTAAAIRGVPINAVKLYPSGAGPMYFAKWVPGSMPVVAATIDIPAGDVYTTAPTDGAGAKMYMLSETITLAANELLLCKMNVPDTSADTGGFWVNASNGGDYAVAVWNTSDNTMKSEAWGLPFSIGYVK